MSALTPTSAVTSAQRLDSSPPGRFSSRIAVIAILIVLAGFSSSFFGAVTGKAPLTLLVHLHALVFFAWLLLFLAQATLVAKGRVAVHQRLGIASVGLAIAMIGIGYQTAITAARRGYDLPLDHTHDPLRFLVFTLGDLLSFTILVTIGLGMRRRVEVHKRLMLLTVVGPMMSAPLVHFFAHLPSLPGPTPALRGLHGRPSVQRGHL
jgi:hypothetical protein